MTSEVLIMNKKGIAIAADSATTLNALGQSKIFNDNKIFSLSKYQPVGIMIYDNTCISGVPAEVLIKDYRKQLGKKSFKTLKEYGDDFIKYLENIISEPGCQISETLQNVTTLQLVLEVCTHSIDLIYAQMDKADKKISPDEFYNLLSVAGEDVRTTYNICDRDRDDCVRSLEKLMTENIKEELKLLLKERNIPFRIKEFMQYVALLILADEVILTFKTGIVIMGYGEDEYLPAYVYYETNGHVFGKLKYRLREHYQLDPESPHIIMPFAQSDVVSGYMEGMYPDMLKISVELLKKALTSALRNTSEYRHGSNEKLNSIVEDQASQYLEMMKYLGSAKYVSPTLLVLSQSPVLELAQMAESLVKLTSMKRRISLDVETVGGPVDVATITKGDGLVWLQRKHYFNLELNPTYVEKYYRGE